MNDALTDPVLLAFIGGLLISTYFMFIGGFNTTQLLISSLGFAGVGIISSTYTYIIHNKMVVQGTTSFCSSEGIVQCGSVIGDPTWNNLFGIPWGIFGIASFSLLIFLSLSLYLDRHAKWAENFLPFVMLLVGIELTQVEGAPHICPFCTVAHISLVGYVIAIYYLKKNKDTGKWIDQG